MLTIDWIFEKNLFSFIQILASLFSYHLEDDDIEAIKYNYKNTDHENNNWFEYNINENINISFSLEKNSTHVFIRIQSEELSKETLTKINFLFDVCQYYFVKDENLSSWYKEL